jgi:hypothetical protein
MLATIAATLRRPRPLWLLLIGAAILAAGYTAITFDADFIRGTATFWNNPQGPWLADSTDTENNIDILSSLSGYYAYAQGPWRFPVFLIPGIAPPEGTSGIFLDVIPIVALVGKLLTAATGVLINPYGVWIAISFIGSAVAASLLLALAGERNWLGTLLASLLALSAPPLLHRFGHLVLLGQFILIFALALYVCAPRLRPRTALWTWLLLLGTALLIGVYFFAMCGTIYLASWLDRLVLRPASVAARWAEPIAIGLVLLVVMVVAGHIGRGTASPFAKGFGYYSMNLAAPFWPQRSGLLPGFWPIIDATGGQYEGFAYFGAGGLLLLAVAGVSSWRTIAGYIATHRGLALVFAGLVVLALSNRIYLFGHLLLDYSFSWRVDQILGTFRSSGRFFLPVYYAALLGAGVLVLRRLPPSASLFVVLVAGGLQLIDTEPLRARMAALSHRDVPWALLRADWMPRAERAKAVFVVPSFNCAGKFGAGINMDIAMLTSLAKRPTNTVYNPRGRTDCAAEAATATQGPWRDDTLYILLSGFATSAPAGFTPPPLHCERFAQGTWCLGKAP